MLFSTLTAATIASWEQEAGPSPIHGVQMDLALGGEIEAHQHARGQIMSAVAGVMSVKVSGRTYVISRERGVWIPEGAPHQVIAPTEVKLHNLQVSRAIAPNLPSFACFIRITPLFRELLANAVEGEKWVRAGSREAKILDLLALEFRVADEPAFSFPEPRDTRLQKICASLKSNPADDRSLDAWSNTAGGCTRTLERLFRRETGLTFAQWRCQVRLHDAVIRLRRGQPVTSVALDEGYENTSAFIDMFRRMTGRTPGQLLNG